MPVYLRVFYIRKLSKLFDTRRKEEEKQAKAIKSRMPRK